MMQSLFSDGPIFGSSGDDNGHYDDDTNKSSYLAFNDARTIGLMGVIHCTLLCSVILWRFSVFVNRTPVYDRWTPLFNKRVLFHSLLLLTVGVDPPMYSTFLEFGAYVLKAYLIHKTSCMWIYLAYSIVVSDWIDVLFDIKEDDEHAYKAKRLVVILGALSVVAVSITNVCMGATYDHDIEAYAHSPMYYAFYPFLANPP